MSVLFNALKASVKSGVKVQSIVLDMLSAGDHDSIIECCVKIESAYPVRKNAEGKDENRGDRNNLLSVLRVQLGRAGKLMLEPQRVTVKSVEGVWAVVVEPIDSKPATPGSKAKPEAGKGSGEAAPDPEAQADAVWAAVEVVLANLGDAAVLSAIRTGLEKLAKAKK